MKRVLSLLVSLAILALIYWRIDVGRMLAVLGTTRAGWLIASLAMVIPLTLLTALRLRILTPIPGGLGLGEAVALILSASVLNLVLPSKMGDVAKSVFMRQQGLGGALALALVVFEKACDMLSLLAWCAVGLVYLPHDGALFRTLTGLVVLGLVGGGALLGSRHAGDVGFKMLRTVSPFAVREKFARVEQAWREMGAFVRQNKVRSLTVATVSLFIWFLHLLQIWMFTVALKAEVPFGANLGLAPLAILAGLLPLTFAGVGTRDAALIVFYQRYFDAATGAALGLLCTSRYVIPAVAGIPFLQRHLQGLRRA